MSSKVKRKVTVEASKSEEEPRRPSVFERLGPNAVNVTSQSSDRHGVKEDPNEKCRNWMRYGTCCYGSTCRFKHEANPSSRRAKTEKDANEKDLRHKVKVKQDKAKESRTDSTSPKRKRTSSRSRKGEHDSKMKSTVVVTRPKTPPATGTTETAEPKKKTDGTWEDDSDEWPMDAAQLDYKEELTLERKRQQLQRELELELQKEQLLNENVTITKTVSFSGSGSSSSSSSGSGSASSSGSNSSGSSSGEDSSDSSSTSSSSSSRSSARKRRREKKAEAPPPPPKSHSHSTRRDRDRHSSREKTGSRASKAKKTRSPTPTDASRKDRDKRRSSPPSSKRHTSSKGTSRSTSGAKHKGPRTPSPITNRKQRQWGQSSSADSRGADGQRGRNKRNKKKKGLSRNEKFKSGRGPSPPPLSSPNRLALLPPTSKKGKSRDESGKSRHRRRDSPTILPLRNTTQPSKSSSSSRHQDDKHTDRSRSDDRSKHHTRREPEDPPPPPRRVGSREKGSKRSRKETSRRTSQSPQTTDPPSSRKNQHENSNKDASRRKTSSSPARRKNTESEKKRETRDPSPRDLEARRDQPFRSGVEKRATEQKVKRVVSPDVKKGRDDRARDHPKDRNVDYDGGLWQGDNRKQNVPGRHSPDVRSRQDVRSQPPLRDRSRDRDQDRKKRKERDLPGRSVEDAERSRLSPRRSQSPVASHLHELDPLSDGRGRLYEAEVERDFPPYTYDPYLSERLLHPADYDAEVLRGPPPGYTAEVYPESRYRRSTKDNLDRYESRDMSPHDIISLTARDDDYLPELSVEDRSFEERWTRGARSREEWDPYPSISPAPLPPHVAAVLDEDRYGMPRRRRADDWPRNREEREQAAPPASHRVGGRGRDGRSRSPPKVVLAANRGSWNERDRRHDNRASERPPPEEAPKVNDDRKGRNNRKDRVKRRDQSEEKLPASTSKDKPKESVKRPHSPSSTATKPPKKKRKESTLSNDLLKYHGVTETAKASSPVIKKGKDDAKTETKSTSKSTAKVVKREISPPKNTETQKKDPPTKNFDDVKQKDREEKKPKKSDELQEEDNFSDWSDGDDELLIQEDFIETEDADDYSKSKKKVDDISDDKSSVSSRHKEKSSGKEVAQDFKKTKDGRVRTTSKEKVPDEIPHPKEKISSSGKEIMTQESHFHKDDSGATEIEDFITTESADYDPISDDELEALIEEPDDSLLKTTAEEEKSQIVDALDVDWSALMSESKKEFVPGFARRRFKAAHVLARIGFSQTLAGPQLSQKIVEICQKQLDEEANEIEGDTKEESKGVKKFAMEHQLAAFHVSISHNMKERNEIFSKVGPYRRALCARRDLQIRKLLCKPINKLASASSVPYTPQYTVVDKDLYKQSLELLRLKKASQVQPKAVGVC